jgi:hypothetical protein
MPIITHRLLVPLAQHRRLEEPLALPHDRPAGSVGRPARDAGRRRRQHAELVAHPQHTGPDDVGVHAQEAVRPFGETPGQRPVKLQTGRGRVGTTHRMVGTVTRMAAEPISNVAVTQTDSGNSDAGSSISTSTFGRNRRTS